MKYKKLTRRKLASWVKKNYRFKRDFIDDLWNTVGYRCIHESDVYGHLRGSRGYSNTTAAMYQLFMELKSKHKPGAFTESEQISKNELREFLKKSKRDRYGEVEHPAQILSYLKIEFDL